MKSLISNTTVSKISSCKRYNDFGTVILLSLSFVLYIILPFHCLDNLLRPYLYFIIRLGTYIENRSHLKCFASQYAGKIEPISLVTLWKSKALPEHYGYLPEACILILEIDQHSLTLFSWPKYLHLACFLAFSLFFFFNKNKHMLLKVFSMQ